MRVSKARFVGSSPRVSSKPGKKLPEFAFVGRSNVGKSSLINSLCGNSKLALTSSTPGKTRLANYFLINEKWYIVDLPGYGYAKLGNRERAEISKVIDDYILNSEELVLLFVLIDSRHDIGKLDKDFITRLGEQEVPFALVMTKCDKQGPKALERQLERDREILGEQWEELPPVFSTSSMNGMGNKEILNYIAKILESI